MSKNNKGQSNNIKNKELEEKKTFRVAFAYALVFVLVLIVFGVTGTYAYYNVTISGTSGTTSISANTPCFNVALSQTSALSLGQYNYPITDTFAKTNGKLTPTKVTIRNSCTSGGNIAYSLYLTSTGTIPTNKLKVRVLKANTELSGWNSVMLNTKGTVTNVPAALKTAVKNKNNGLENGEYRLIETSNIAQNTTVEYSVYLWIDYNATANDVAGKTFSSLVSAVIN